MSDDFELVRDAVRWHEYGSQDERRKKALPALDRIEAERDRLREERDMWERASRNCTAKYDRLRAEKNILRMLLVEWMAPPEIDAALEGTSDE